MKSWKKILLAIAVLPLFTEWNVYLNTGKAAVMRQKAVKGPGLVHYQLDMQAAFIRHPCPGTVPLLRRCSV